MQCVRGSDGFEFSKPKVRRGKLDTLIIKERKREREREKEERKERKGKGRKKKKGF